MRFGAYTKEDESGKHLLVKEYVHTNFLLEHILAYSSNSDEKVDIIAPNHFPKEVMVRMHKEFTEYFKQFYIKRYGGYNEKIVRNDCNLYIYEMMVKDMNLDQYDIFHAQDRFTANVLGRLNQVYQKPLFFTPHGFMTHSKLKFNLIKKGSLEESYFLSIDRQAIESSSHMIIPCEAFRPILKKLGAQDSKMTTIYTGIKFGAETIRYFCHANHERHVADRDH